MFCPECGKQVPETAAFCNACGYRFPNREPQNIPWVRQTQHNPQTQQFQQSRRYSAAQTIAKARRKNRGVTVVSLVALLLVAAVLVYALSGLGAPLAQIGLALKKTVTPLNLTANFTMGNDEVEIEGILQLDIDREERDLCMYLEVWSDDRAFILGLIDGYGFFVREDSRRSYYDYAELDEEQLEEFFNALDEAGDAADLEELLKKVDEMLESAFGEKVLSEYFHIDDLAVCLKQYFRDANSAKWLKDNAGFSKSREDGVALYSFAPNPYDYLAVSLPYLEDAFKRDYYDDAWDLLDDCEEYLQDEFYCEGTIGIHSGYIRTLDLTVGDDHNEVVFHADILDAGKTVIARDRMNDLLDEAMDNA